MNSWRRWLLILGLVIVSLVWLFSYTQGSGPNGTWSYSDLVSHAQSGQVSTIVISGTSGVATDKAGKKYDVSLPSDQTLSLADELKTEGVNVSFQSATSLSYILLSALPNLIFFVILGVMVYWVYRNFQRNQNQAFSFGRSKPKMSSPQSPAITFADVAGVDEAQEELAEVVEFLKTPERFVSLGARIPRGVLMVGPPGSGKTLLARAVAGEAGVPFFSISGSEFVEMFVGVGASRVRDLFEQAKKASPCIVFVDEIDAVGRQRGAGLGGGNDEREQTLNQLLVEMDGFDTDTHVIVIAATNRPDVLDPALLRPGRFDRHVTLDRPDVRGRLAILNVHVRNKPLASEVNLETIARQTPGFCGADLANLVNEGAILAGRSERKSIGMIDLEEAIYRVIAGPERKSMRISDVEKRIVAVHESGHALVMQKLPLTDKVHRISIISRGSALGWTLGLPEDDTHLLGKDALKDQLAGLLGGRAAEEIVFGNITSGAENDIKRATQLVRRMVTQWGMSEKIGPVALGENQDLVFLGRDLGSHQNYSEEIAAQVDSEVHRIMEEALATAHAVLTECRSALNQLTETLIVEETVEGYKLDQILAKASSSS